MSAWMVSRNHINYLVAAALHYRAIKPNEVTKVGKMLTDENIRSLEHRYPGRCDDLIGDARKRYRFDFPEQEIDHVLTIKAIACYGYQACEHDGWESSDAKAFVDALEQDAVDRLPPSMRAEVDSPYGGTTIKAKLSPEYDAAPWGL